MHFINGEQTVLGHAIEFLIIFLMYGRFGDHAFWSSICNRKTDHGRRVQVTKKKKRVRMKVASQTFRIEDSEEENELNQQSESDLPMVNSSVQETSNQ